MDFDFNQPVDRQGSEKYRDRDILPMWVADTDFRSPPAVVEALHERAAHGVFGYGETPPGLVETVLATLAREFSWAVDPAWLVWFRGWSVV